MPLYTDIMAKFFSTERNIVYFILVILFVGNQFRLPILPEGTTIRNGFFGDGILYDKMSEGLPFRLGEDNVFTDRPI